MTTVFVFPGQGSQAVGMLAALAVEYPEVQLTFAQASAVLGYDLWQVTQQGPEDQLNSTECTQPAMLAAGIATLRVWQRRGGPAPDVVAGHSLGEFSALVAAESLDFAAAIDLVRWRGRFMQEAVPAGEGAMGAVIGLDGALVAEACAEVEASTGETVSAANFNSPEQTVIAGTTNGVAKAGELLRQKGAKRVLPLPVSAPFHCALMKPAEEKLGPFLDAAPFADLAVPVVTNVDVLANLSGAEAREALRRQVCSPVRWVETVQRLSRDTEGAIEVGPGTVLAGLAKRIAKDWPVRTTSDAEGIARLLAG